MKNNGFLPSEKIYSVSELTLLIKTQLEETFPVIWVEGEISNFFRHHSGHLYFTLKDKKCQLRTVMFRSDASRIKFDLKDGLQVIGRGRINVYEPRGEYQLMVDSVEPKGKGALQLAFEQLKSKLKEEGLFDLERKKPLPMLSKKVGIITSPRGAAISDIIRTLERRFGRTHIVIYPVKVQGEGAWKEIVEGIDFFCLDDHTSTRPTRNLLSANVIEIINATCINLIRYVEYCCTTSAFLVIQYKPTKTNHIIICDSTASTNTSSVLNAVRFASFAILTCTIFLNSQPTTAAPMIINIGIPQLSK